LPLWCWSSKYACLMLYHENKIVFWENPKHKC
jgi:hypothetical protein